MTKQAINVGTTANDKKGDSLRAAFQKVNANFTELYEAVGLADTGQDTALTFVGSTLSTDDSSSIVIDRATTVTSNLSVGGDILPQTALGGDLGSSTLPWRSLYVSNNTIFIGGTAVGVDANGALTTGGTVVGSTPAWANITGKPTFATVATTGAYADLTGKPTIPTLVSQLANDSGFLTSVGNISNIQSESDVSIQVNLTDSTTRIWQFGEDGNLAVPGDINLSGGTISQYSQNGLTGLKLVANADQGQNVTIMGTGNNTFPILNYVGTTLSGITIGTPEGDWNFMNGNLTIPGDIRSEGNINIDINLSDSTLRRWQFGEDGNLTFPDGTNQSTAYTGNAATVDITNTNGIDTNYSITFVENRDGAEILRADVDLTFNSATNLLTAGNVTTGILKINDGVHEQFQAKADATGVVTHDCSSGHIFRHTSPDANWTANFTNLNLDSTYATSVTLIIAQGATGYYPSAVQIGGAAQTINWQGNVNPTVSTSRTDVVTFSIINNSGTYTVLGQLTGF